MNDFVEECRREWKRLGVPDAVANEMAADLAVDLEEAAAEGASPEDVLGTGVLDPKGFAASWAAERGVVGAAAVPRRRWPAVPAALVGFAIVAVLGLVLAIVASPTGSVRLAVAPTAIRVAVPPLPRLRREVVLPRMPRFRIALAPRASRAAAVELRRTRGALWWAGLSLLLAGVAGALAVVLVRLRA